MKIIEQHTLNLSKNQLICVLNDIPSIEVEFDWDNGLGIYDRKDHEIEFNNWCIRCNLQVTEFIQITPSTHMQPLEFYSCDYSVCIDQLELWNESNKVTLTDTQIEEIITKITNNIA